MVETVVGNIKLAKDECVLQVFSCAYLHIEQDFVVTSSPEFYISICAGEVPGMANH